MCIYRMCPHTPPPSYLGYMFTRIYFQIVYQRPILTYIASSFRLKSSTVANSQKLFLLQAHLFHNGWSYISPLSHMTLWSVQGGLPLLIPFRKGKFASKNKYSFITITTLQSRVSQPADHLARDTVLRCPQVHLKRANMSQPFCEEQQSYNGGAAVET